MSTWTVKEVQGLKEKHGGGNTHCRAKWLGKAKDLDRVLPHHSLDGHKRFIDVVFNRMLGHFFDLPKGSNQTASRHDIDGEAWGRIKQLIQRGAPLC